MNGKLTITTESTGWTLVAVGYPDNPGGFGEFIQKSYVSGRHHAGPHAAAKRLSDWYGGLEIVWAGNSADYDRELAAIAADPHFMS